MYVLNTGFQFQEKDPYINYIYGDFWLTFSLELGINTLVQIGSHEVVTDVGMTPFVFEETTTGYHIANTIQMANNFNTAKVIF